MLFVRKLPLIFFRIVLGFFALLLLYAALALVLGYWTTGDYSPAPDASTTVFVRTNGVHTDFVVPVRSPVIDWSQQFPYQHFRRVDSTYQYLAFGWGDKGFYLYTPEWSDLKFSTAFNALFFLSTTAMHVTYYRNPPVADESCRRIHLTEAQYRALVTYITRSFRTDETGQLQLIAGKGYGDRDNFYEARGTYSFLRTCNVWTGSGLRHTGIRTPLWSPFDRAILHHLPQ